MASIWKPLAVVTAGAIAIYLINRSRYSAADEILIARARDFGSRKHCGQTRKDNTTPYFVHPMRVAARVESVSSDKHLIAAAFLHDTLEDTQTTIEELQQHFGDDIATLVHELSSDEKAIEKIGAEILAEGTHELIARYSSFSFKDDSKRAKAIGKAVYLADKLNNMSSRALIVKLADRLDNVSDMVGADKEFMRRYAVETSFLLESLKRNDLAEAHLILIAAIGNKVQELLAKTA